MKIDILTLFPKMFHGPFDESIIKRAMERKLVEINIHNLRDWTEDRHRTVDDRPFGGGKGMVIKVDIIDRALQELKQKNTKVILLSPQGKTFTQKKAEELSKLKHLILISGHYEGFDERIREHLIDDEISIGEYVLTGGELPAMVITDTIVRLIPKVLDEEAITKESFSEKGVLDFPQYTKPQEYKGWKVPNVLLSGDHAEIEKWRKKKAIGKSKRN